jgi:hypothetical protein
MGAVSAAQTWLFATPSSDAGFHVTAIVKACCWDVAITLLGTLHKPAAQCVADNKRACSKGCNPDFPGPESNQIPDKTM